MLYFKTDAGQLAFKQRSPLLSVRQRSAFIIFDGLKSLEQVFEATAGMGISQTDIDHMLTQGLISKRHGSSGTPVSPPPPPASVSLHTEEERYHLAWPLATQLTASLGLRGFSLNLDAEVARGFEDLLVLLPKIHKVAGVKRSFKLAHALHGIEFFAFEDACEIPKKAIVASGRLNESTLQVIGALQIYRSGDYTEREFLMALSFVVLNCQPKCEDGLSIKEMSSFLGAHKSASKSDVGKAVDTLVAWCDQKSIKIVDGAID